MNIGYNYLYISTIKMLIYAYVYNMNIENRYSYLNDFRSRI